MHATNYIFVRVNIISALIDICEIVRTRLYLYFLLSASIFYDLRSFSYKATTKYFESCYTFEMKFSVVEMIFIIVIYLIQKNNEICLHKIYKNIFLL